MVKPYVIGMMIYLAINKCLSSLTQTLDFPLEFMVAKRSIPYTSRSRRFPFFRTRSLAVYV